MTKPALCPLCHQAITPEQGPVVMGSDGFPDAVSLIPGLGLPIVEASSCSGMVVLLDDRKVDRCIGYDRPGGIVWRYMADGSGAYVVRGGSLVPEKLTGEVTVQARES